METLTAPPPTDNPTDLEILDTFRRWGYLEARLDPLGRLPPLPLPELDGLGGSTAERARAIYCGSIAAEFMHLADPARRRWVAERMEAPGPDIDAPEVLERLVRAELFEQVLQQRYLGSKRFSLEGVTSLIPLLDEIWRVLAASGAEQIVIAMSHRGRLNVMANFAGVPAMHLFTGFEDVDPRSVLGSGDVKYHLGATGHHPFDTAEKVRIHLVSNPSHLEVVHPVALGRVRAKQTRLGPGSERKVVAIILHGDAAFAGQGITAEALNLSGLHGYEVGGALHVVVNNLIGFTTEPHELHSSRFATDVARRLPSPIFHVNGEDLPAVAKTARMATEFKLAFGCDVVVDLIGYRRHGHSEVDDPTITQPMLYRALKAHPQLWQRFAAEAGLESEALAARVKAEYEAAQTSATALAKKPVLAQAPGYWAAFKGGPYEAGFEVPTALPAAELERLAARLTAVPEGFHVHPKIKKLLAERLEMGEGKKALDFGMAEALAFASLVARGVPVRLSGQDSRRGTFSHRHAVLIDTENEHEHVPLTEIAPGQGRFEVYNSMLSEAAVMAYEFGYSRDYPETLVLWEAQFGDFANGAQIVIDQFLAAAEDKWTLLSGLVLLLPHGYEGQGPEHSSARVERYLQLAAEDNFQVAQPSTAGQYFHLLRRQALRAWRKPLVVFTPKSMLRHPLASSPREVLTDSAFEPVLHDFDLPTGARRILLTSGKIRHELREERDRRKDHVTAIVSLEQLYPFPTAELEAELARHPEVTDVVWVQEEPGNMGALSYVMPRIEDVVRKKAALRSIKRSASASPATGSAKAHQLEQKSLLALAFTTRV
ncbi:MAG: 2-oxoglutarate dehydrogenase E1 component [Thermoanaerobaculia bacterium]